MRQFHAFNCQWESRANAAARWLRRAIVSPGGITDIANYDAVVAKWGVNIAKWISHREQDKLLVEEDLSEACRGSLQPCVVTFAQLNVHGPMDLMVPRRNGESHLPENHAGKSHDVISSQLRRIMPRTVAGHH